MFALMPLEHSEDLAHHGTMRDALLSLDCVQKMGGEKSPLVGFLEKHTEILRQFGRYPHRNEALGRASTPAEVKYLQGDADTFGQ